MSIAKTIQIPGVSEAEQIVPPAALALAQADAQRGIPAIAKDSLLVEQIEDRLPFLATRHELWRENSHDLARLAADSVHLALTTPPRWALDDADDGVAAYEAYLDHLDDVWRQVYRLLAPGGRLVIVAGDLSLPRRSQGRHLVLPLHAGLQERCRRLGFDNLTPIIWYKTLHADLDQPGPPVMLGKPYEPNAIIKDDVEYLLFQRKPGGYRSPSLTAKILSVIPEARHREWFQQVWTLREEGPRDHPGALPRELAERLVRMFSFVGDTVLDPFMNVGTVNAAAARWGRHSIGIETEPTAFREAMLRIEAMQVRQMRLPLEGEWPNPTQA